MNQLPEHQTLFTPVERIAPLWILEKANGEVPKRDPGGSAGGEGVSIRDLCHNVQYYYD